MVSRALPGRPLWNGITTTQATSLRTTSQSTDLTHPPSLPNSTGSRAQAPSRERAPDELQNKTQFSHSHSRTSVEPSLDFCLGLVHLKMFTCCFNCNTSHVVKSHTRSKKFTITAYFCSNSKQVCSVYENAFIESPHYCLHFRSLWHCICFTRWVSHCFVTFKCLHVILGMELEVVRRGCLSTSQFWHTTHSCICKENSI